MSDNINVTPGSGAVIGADDCTVEGVANVKIQRIKAGHGQAGSYDGDVSTINGLPIGLSQVQTTEDIVEKSYSFYTTSFQSVGIANVTTSTHVFIWNDTNGNLYYNWDNGVSAEFIVPAKCARLVRVKVGATGLYSKYASAPTAGTCYHEVRKG